MIYSLSERVLVPVGVSVTHRRFGWRGRVGYGSTVDQAMVIWPEYHGASMAAYEDLEIEYPEVEQ